VTERRHPARERAHFDQIGAEGRDIYWAERTPAGRRRREIRSGLLATVAAAALGDGAHILDIGCGTAAYTMPFARRTGATVVGIDVAPTLLARALSEVPRNVRLVAADVEALPFATGAFDAVIGNAVLHHLRLERALPELLRVLRPGGRFCFAEPNMLNPQVFVERNVRFIGRWLDNSPDETAFTRWGLRRTLARHGLVDVAIRPFDFLYPLTPERLVPMVERVGRLLERTPLVAEIAGSLLVSARKP
jgi:SAM-dependent methyltransferase